MSLAILQNLINETQPGGTCFFPENGTYNINELSVLNINKSITIDGNGAVFNYIGSALPTIDFLNMNSLVNGFDVTMRNLTINGPDSSSWSIYTELNKSAIGYVLYKTWDSKLVLENIKVTGAYGYAVHRAGGGKLEIKDCELSGWVGSLAFFEGHGGHGDLLIRDTICNAPINSKYSSIGMYIHPHLHLTAERVSFKDWNRFAIYLNGSPQSAGNHDLIDVTAENCSLIQTGSSSTTTLVRCKEMGIPKNGGSFMKGPVSAIDCTWLGKGTIGFLPNNNVRRVFFNNHIEPISRWAAFGSNTRGTVELIDTEVKLNGVSSLLAITSNSTASGVLNNVGIDNQTSKLCLVIEGGSLKLVNTSLPVNVKITAPGYLL